MLGLLNTSLLVYLRSYNYTCTCTDLFFLISVFRFGVASG